MHLSSKRLCKFHIGDFKCYILYDGIRSVGSMSEGSAKRFLFGDAPEAEFKKCLEPYGGFNSSTILPFNYLLLKYGKHYTLIDTGCGDRAENNKNTKEPAGFLVKSLIEASVQVEDVDTVIVSHCHWDHFGGVISDGEITFPNAEYYMSRKEANYIRDTKSDWTLDYLNIIEDKVTYVSDSEILDEGITLKLAPGHTPGLLVVEVSSGGEALLYTSDIIIHPVHVEHTDWIPSFEYDHTIAAATRSKLVEEAYERNLILFVPHIPKVLGRIKHSLAGYRWINENNNDK